MNQVPDQVAEESQQAQTALIWVGIAILLMTVGLVVLAVVLAANADTAAPGVRIVRDLLIIVMALELIIIGASVVVFLVQVARLVNLVNNELQPLIGATSETINTVRGTAAFLSKNLVEPVIALNSTLRGLAKVAGDVDMLRKAAGIIAAAANASTPTSTFDNSPEGSTSNRGDEVETEVSDRAADARPSGSKKSTRKTRKEK